MSVVRTHSCDKEEVLRQPVLGRLHQIQLHSECVSQSYNTIKEGGGFANQSQAWIVDKDVLLGMSRFLLLIGHVIDTIMMLYIYLQ